MKRPPDDPTEALRERHGDGYQHPVLRRDAAFARMSATRAAVEEGIVPGGGVALITVASVLDNVKVNSPEEQTGVNIVRRALEEPMRGITRNAGLDGSVIVQEVLRRQKDAGSTRIGFDVMSEEYVDMVKAGIIDPAKVTRGALSNAASIAAMILTTEALVTDVPVKDKPAAPPMPEY